MVDQMPKVMLSLSNYNKFVDFIGRDWLEENTARYLDKPDGGAHAFVPMHLQMMSYTPLMGSIPKRIYMQQRLCWYQKFSFLGSFVDLVEPLLPNPTRFRRRLRESDHFDNTVFEMLTMGILINSRYQVIKLKEGQHHTPDYLATSPTTMFTVEATRKNIPGKIEDISPYSQKLLYDILYPKP